jgi:hypothetical protein
VNLLRSALAACSRQGRRLLLLIMLLVALLALVPLLGIDPGVLALVLDLDFLALAGSVGLALLQQDARMIALRIARSLPVLWVRVGLAVTREAPRTLLA